MGHIPQELLNSGGKPPRQSDFRLLKMYVLQGVV
jgi:hypothetical protein